MARARNIKPSFFLSENLADIEPLGRLLFIGLWTICDFNGNLKWEPRKIKVQILPYDDCDISKLMIDLDKSRSVLFYADHSQIYVNIPKFPEHQNPHPNEKKKGTDIPEFSEMLRQAIDLERLVINRDQSLTDRAESLIPYPESLNLNPESPTSESLSLNPESGANGREYVEQIFEYWQTVMDKGRCILSDKRRKNIKARLKDFTIEQIKTAIDGCRKSEFHMGKNDRKTEYNDIELICRNVEKLEGFIGICSQQSSRDKELQDWIADGDAIEGDAIDEQ